MSTEHGRDFPDYSGGYGSAQGEHGASSQGGRTVEDPYAVGPGGADPYAQDPLSADGYAPAFSSEQGVPAGYAVAPYAAQHPGAYPVGPPGYGYFPSAPPSSGSAITGFVLGLLGLTFCGGITAPFGVYFSAVGMKETGPSATTVKSGRGLAIAGLVTSLIGLIPLAFVVFYIVMMIILIASGVASS